MYDEADHSKMEWGTSSQRVAERTPHRLADDNYTGPDGRADNGAVQQARLRVDSRRWLLSKLMPRKYGDKVTQEIIGEDGTRIELVPVAPRRQEELWADGDEASEVRLFPPRLADRRSG